MKNFRIILVRFRFLLVAVICSVFLTGCCCLICEHEIYYSPSGKAFPYGWGEPPKIQTKDYVPLPYGYGHGSSTLKKWIEFKKHEDNFIKALNNLSSAGF
tara:strand:+ start:2393 stop:2692 length:300 start_codon:yes stop_codon:yes gene_type:complete